MTNSDPADAGTHAGPAAATAAAETARTNARPGRSGQGYTEFSYADAEGVEIFAYEWAADEPVGVVQIAHGVGEHALRYDAFARALVAAGFTVYADDHRGHGKTGSAQHGGDLSQLGRLGPGGLRAAEAAILRLTAIIRERHPGLPLVMFAHSWGSLMAQRILNREPRVFDAVVLSGSAFRTARFMESGDLNARWKQPGPDGAAPSGFEWLSRDRRTAEEFVADPLCFAADIRKLFGTADALRLFGRPSRDVAPEVPILIVSGADDPLSRGDGLHRLAEAYRRRGVRDVVLRIYPGARHELLNETNRDDAIAEIITWITDRTGE